MATAGAQAVDLVTSGFSLDQLLAASGQGGDPGTRNLQARLDWAVRVAIPPAWANIVPVRWEVSDTGSGKLALSYLAGDLVEVSPRLMHRSAEEVLDTVAHEFGHKMVFRYVAPYNGTPPSQFAAHRGPGYRSLAEAWADCVARVWTGSLKRTLSERQPCPEDAARWVSGLLADPSRLLRGPGPDIVVVPKPVPVPEPPPVPPVISLPADVTEPPDPAGAALAVRPVRGVPEVAASQKPSNQGTSLALLVGIALVVPGGLSLAGFALMRSPRGQLLLSEGLMKQLKVRERTSRIAGVGARVGTKIRSIEAPSKKG
jgi:hypothetical protein